MAVLMCKDQPVYDISHDKVLNKPLCPLLKMSKNNFNAWLEGRHYVKTNRIAEGSVRRANSINKQINKRRLSLSDCYWIKYAVDESVNFNSITPYNLNNSFVNNWSNDTHSTAVPDATLGGSLPKTWCRVDGVLGFYKGSVGNQVYMEMAALTLAYKLKINACKAFTNVLTQHGKTSDGKPLFTRDRVNTLNFHSEMENIDSTIFIENIANTNQMLMTLDTLGVNSFRATNMGHRPSMMVSLYRKIFDVSTAVKYVITTILFDMIVSNYDRVNNIYNWGYLKSPDTGTVALSPLYDFNFARKSPRLTDIDLIIQRIKKIGVFKDLALKYLSNWIPLIKEFGITQWHDTALYIEKQLMR